MSQKKYETLITALREYFAAQDALVNHPDKQAILDGAPLTEAWIEAGRLRDSLHDSLRELAEASR